MQLRLTIRIPGGSTLVDDQLDTSLSESDRQVLFALAGIPGEVEFIEGGATVLRLPDDLAQLIPHLCLWSRVDLCEGKAVTVRLWSDPTTLTFTPADGRLRIETSVGDSLECSRDLLLEALLQQGKRFVAFVRREFGDRPTWQEWLDDQRYALLKADPDGPSIFDERGPSIEPPQLTPEEIEAIFAEQEKAAADSAGNSPQGST